MKLEKSTSLTPLGPDRDAILEQHREATLYDTGLGARLAARICLRAADPQLAARLNAAIEAQPGIREGYPGDGAGSLQSLVYLPVADGYDRTFDIIVETGLGRAEIFAPAAPRWLDANRLAAARETPPGWDLRPVFALGALFYPGRG